MFKFIAAILVCLGVVAAAPSGQLAGPPEFKMFVV